MKISKKNLTRLVKEAILKDQYIVNRLVEKMPPNKPGDIPPLEKAIDSKLQGPAEYQYAAKAFIEFIANFKREQATIQMVHESIMAAIQELGVEEAEAARLAGVMRRIFMLLGAKAVKQDAEMGDTEGTTQSEPQYAE